MPREAAQLLNEALELPAEARAALADSLLDSLDTAEDTDVDQAWRVEIERRIVFLDEKSAKLVPWEDVHARLNRRLQR